ncbi:HAD family hydrolase [Kitasatospora saccharophila]|uniref:HAD family hydrolase n=1 Tax=Kitasatospora saccharophila TaxID=407973 RepID=UPI0036267A31
MAELGDPGAVPVFAAGDGPADLDLLRWARIGVAPAHAPAELHSAARVSASSYQAGLAEGVALLLGHPRAAAPAAARPAPPRATAPCWHCSPYRRRACPECRSGCCNWQRQSVG